MNNEVAKSVFFTILLISNKITDVFRTGPLPLPIDNAYSLYGRSVNDLCIVHKNHYMCAGW